MASKLLEIVIKARDEATDTLKGISKTLKANENDLKNVAVASGLAFGGIVAFAGNALKSASEAEKVQAQLGAVLKSTGGIAGVTADQAIKLSQSLQKVSTFGDEAILSAQNMLLTFTNIGSKVFPEATQTVLDMSVALGQDLKSSSIQLGKALNNPIDGITALTRVGVKFTDQQKDMITKLVESGDVMGAQKVILKELAMEFGGSASAEAKTFGGQIQQITEMIGDFNESIGNALMPLLKNLSANIKPVIEAMIKWVDANPKLTAVIILTTLAITGLIFAVSTLSLAFLALSATPVGLAIAGIGALIIAILIPTIMYLITHWESLKETAFAVWTSITSFVDTGVKTIGDLIDSTMKNIKAVWEFTLLFLNEFIINTLGLIMGSVDFFLTLLDSKWREHLQAILDFVILIFTSMGEYIYNLLNVSFNYVMNQLEIFSKWWAGIWTAVKESLKSVWEEIKSVLVSAVDYILDKMAPLIKTLEKVISLGNKVQSIASSFGSKLSGGLEQLGDGLSSIISSGKKSLGVNDAIISPDGRVITTHPDDYLIATKTPGSLAGGNGMSLTINMNGGTYLDPGVAEDIGDMIIQRFKQIAKI